MKVRLSFKEIMANWKHVINISDEYRLFNDEECTVQDVALKIHTELKLSPYTLNDEIVSVLDRLTSITENSSLNDPDDVEDFNDIINDIYDFGDVDNRLFVKTF